MVIDIAPREIRKLWLQENNCLLQFQNINPVSKLEIDFDNTGFQVFHDGAPIQNIGWITPPTSFTTLGSHNIKVRFRPSLASTPLLREYDATVVPRCQRLYIDNTQRNNAFGGQLTTGNVITLWDNPNCPNAHPVLLSEGYDATNVNFPEFYRSKARNLIERLFESGYKVYVLNYNLANQDLRNNAAVYTSALKYISSINNGQDVMAVGVSMGGVIARYALTNAESQGIKLPVASFMSFDAPQQGAVIDRDFQDFIKSLPTDPPPALVTQASKQLLINHAWDPNETEHNAFYNELKSLNGNGYPKNIVNIGVAHSKNVPNPNTAGNGIWGRMSVNFIGPFTKSSLFFVKNEWALAGSLLPIESTNLEPASFLQAFGDGIEVERFSHPTFIPYKSALDKNAQGISPFNILIEQTESSPSFHDEVPGSVIETFINTINADIATIAANETFNFTAQRQFIGRDLNIFGRMGLNKNLPSGSSFNPEPKVNVPFQKLLTNPCTPININVSSNGSIDIGDTGGGNQEFNGSLTLKTGDVLRINNGGILQVNLNSQLIVGSGARLIIENGANINLVGLESKIIVKQGGQLIINGQPTNTGNGHFRFEQGNIFTLNSNLILTGTGRTNPLVKIAGGATIVVNTPFELRIDNAAVIHETGLNDTTHIFLRNGSTFRAFNTLFDDRQVILFGPRTATFIKVDDPFDLNNNPDDVDYSFDNCIFQNTGIAVELDVTYAQNDAVFDWRNVNVEFINSTFSNCQAIKADRSYITLIEDCTLTNANIDMSHTYWLNIRNTTIRSNAFGPTDHNYASYGYGIKATHVGHFWFRENSLIDGWGTGIDASSGLNWNIIMTDQSTIQRCATAIHLNGTKFNEDVDLGLLHMDCGRLIENAAAIKGQDIIFSAYTRNGTANVFTRNMNNATGLFIESIFRNRHDTELWFHGNYWDGTTPAITPVNSAWSFLTRYGFPQPAQPWIGNIHINPDLRTSEFDPAVRDICGGINLRGAQDDPLAKRTIVNINGVLYDVKKQYDAALRILKKDKFKNALNTFRPIAQIPRSIRDTASATVKHFVDMARALTLNMGVETRSVSSNGWLSEAIVGIAKPENALVLSPNPANEQFEITLPQGNYDVHVFDALGKRIFSKNTEGVATVDVRTWLNGIYIVNLLDKVSKKKTFSKVVVQH